MMIEAGADEVSEQEVIKALEFAQKEMQPAIKLQNDLIKKIGVTPLEYNLSLPSEEIQKQVDEWLKGKLGANIRTNYPDRHQKMHDLRLSLLEHFELKLGSEDFDKQKQEYEDAFAAAANKDVRAGIVKENLTAR